MADPVEQFLTRLHHPVLAGIDLSLDRMLRLLAMLGNPQRRLPPVVHVAGTNGKGSLLAYLLSVTQEAGYGVHRYTSPHLVHFRERILLRGREIDNAYLQTIVGHVARCLQSQPVTFFEAATAAAFLAFAEKPADLLLLETGMGGRLDATNVVDKPVLTVITPVSLDHCEFLGDKIEAIAAEKAGIFKRGVPCVVGRQSPEALAVIEARAAALDVPLHRYGKEWHVEWRGDEACYRSASRLVPLHPSLAGQHQFDNAATAIACLEALPQFPVSEAHIAAGLAKAVWPARLPSLTQGAYARALPQGFELWLDGGHNPQGGEILAQWLKQRQMEAHLICGMSGNKDTAAYLRPVAPYATQLYAVAIPDEPQARSAAFIEAAARGEGIRAEAAASVEKALQTIVQRAKTPAIICICGSLYLAGKVLAANQTE